jgi:hypothetical protein
MPVHPTRGRPLPARRELYLVRDTTPAPAGSENPVRTGSNRPKTAERGAGYVCVEARTLDRMGQDASRKRGLLFELLLYGSVLAGGIHGVWNLNRSVNLPSTPPVVREALRNAQWGWVIMMGVAIIGIGFVVVREMRRRCNEA